MKTTKFPSVFGDSVVLITAKKCQTLDEYGEKTVRGAMECGVLERNYNYFIHFSWLKTPLFPSKKWLIMHTIKSWPRSTIFDSPTVESQYGRKIRQNDRKKW